MGKTFWWGKTSLEAVGNIFPLITSSLYFASSFAVEEDEDGESGRWKEQNKGPRVCDQIEWERESHRG